MERLETARLILRPARDADAADLFEYARDPRVGPIAGWPPHKDHAESLDVIRTVFAAPGVAVIELKETGKMIGTVGFVDRHRTELPGPDDEIGYALNPAYWGLGLMPEAVHEVMRHGFETLGLAAIWCGYYDGNDKSRRVVEKSGFRYRFSCEANVELMGEVRLEHHYALTKEEWLAR